MSGKRVLVGAQKMPGMVCGNCREGILFGGHLADTTVAMACGTCGLNLTAQLARVRIEGGDA